MIEISERLSIPSCELKTTFARSSGPGGQNVNKVSSKVVLKWQLTDSALPEGVLQRFRTRYGNRINQEGEVVIISQRFRDQGQNIRDCYNKLRAMVLSVAEPPRRRKATKPTRASRERRVREKRRQAEKKQLRKKPRPDD